MNTSKAAANIADQKWQGIEIQSVAWKIPIIGDAHVGKTTLLLSLCDPDFYFPCLTTSTCIDSKELKIMLDEGEDKIEQTLSLWYT